MKVKVTNFYPEVTMVTGEDVTIILMVLESNNSGCQKRITQSGRPAGVR